MSDYIKEAQALIHEKLGLQKSAAPGQKGMRKIKPNRSVRPPADYQPPQYSPAYQKEMDTSMQRSFKEPGSFKRIVVDNLPEGSWQQQEAIQKGKTLGIYTDPPARTSNWMNMENDAITQGREQGYEYMPWLHNFLDWWGGKK
ncbi:MAG: hypothetical protein IJU53_13975 [Thermoguttaceae bacterium]|nr:hypothetical protein [Thermoguttaceae bacterium]